MKQNGGGLRITDAYNKLVNDNDSFAYNALHNMDGGKPSEIDNEYSIYANSVQYACQITRDRR